MSSSVKSFLAAVCSNKVQVQVQVKDKDPNVFSLEEATQALAAFNAVMAADPFQQAIEKGESWADVNEAAEAWNKRMEARAKEPVCPNAPKKAKLV